MENNDAKIEKLIYKAKESGYTIPFSHGNDMITEIIHDIYKNKLLAYQLIEKKENGSYRLTNKGVQFTSFKDEDEKVDMLNRKLKIDVKNAERIARSYPWTQSIAWVTFFLALFLGFLKLAEVLKLWPYHK